MYTEPMEEHFTRLLGRLEEITISASQPEVIADPPRFSALMKEMAALQPQTDAWLKYERLRGEIAAVREMLSQPDMKKMAEEELRALEEQQSALEAALKALLLPRDEDDERDVVMEIRAGTGGEEAALFSAQLLRMYTRFAERHGFSVTLLSVSDSDLGGVKEAVFTVKGHGAFSRLKYESGAHCVKRVPVTESSGRLHTSTATVAVLPVWEDAEVDIAPGDIRVDVYRSSGHGGQSVNTTDSAVRITHLPTGLVVTCQNEKSQIKNREQAMKVLRVRLYDRARAEKDQEYAKKRKGLVGSGERSEKIRTYHFLQGRVTDHRIGLTLYQVDLVMDGDLDGFIDALATHENTQQTGAQSA